MIYKFFSCSPIVHVGYYYVLTYVCKVRSVASLKITSKCFRFLWVYRYDKQQVFFTNQGLCSISYFIINSATWAAFLLMSGKQVERFIQSLQEPSFWCLLETSSNLRKRGTCKPFMGTFYIRENVARTCILSISARWYFCCLFCRIKRLQCVSSCKLNFRNIQCTQYAVNLICFLFSQPAGKVLL